jgi:DNA-binding NarL/FixJ family response regulator
MSPRRPTVLLADDHPLTAAMLRSLLEGPFDVIDCVSDGEALISAAASLSPDVIVSDIGLPRIDGLDAARRILATNRDARVVFVTVQSDVSVVERSLEDGALGYVVKMVAGDELVAAVHAALRGQRHVRGIAGFREDGADSRGGADGGSTRRDGG